MTREEVKKRLGENATDEQISAFLDALHESEKSYKDQLASKDKELSKFSDYDEMKSKLKSIEDEKLTEQEKLAKDREEITRQLKEAKITNNTAKAKEILAGIKISDNLLSRLVVEDIETTISNANDYLSSINTLKEETIKLTKEELSSLNVKPNIDNKNLDNGAMTWEKFTSLSQEEQSKFQQEHSEEFEKL